MNRSLAAMMWVVCAVCTVSASAQVFYEPVQYQFGSGNGIFYYGGHDPRVIDDAKTLIRSREYSSVVRSRHVTDQCHVYSDSFHAYEVAEGTYTGYSTLTVNDARNEANQNVPRYFRKKELLNAAVATEDGSWTVPAHAQPVYDIKVVKPFGTNMGPVAPKGTILIVPRKWLEKPAKRSDPSVAMAQP